jgi:hypothetical protein
LFSRFGFGMACTLVALLGSCAPVATRQAEGPSVALINAPAEDRVSPAADALQPKVESVPGCCGFSFVRSRPVRFQETHRDFFGSRAAPSSAALARNLGAELAVMVGAPLFERTARNVDGAREVRGRVQFRATVVDADSGESLGTVGSLTFRDFRLVGEDEPLPELDEDPTMLALMDEALSDLAPHLAALLQDLTSEPASGSSS